MWYFHSYLKNKNKVFNFLHLFFTKSTKYYGTMTKVPTEQQGKLTFDSPALQPITNRSDSGAKPIKTFSLAGGRGVQAML